MYGASQGETPRSKLYVCQGRLPKKINAGQPPSKKQPFLTILKQAFTHSAQVILPEELYDVVWKNVASRLQPLEYSRVILPLSALLEGDFFNTYIKSGLLRLQLPKEIYEKAGLVGEPIRDAGRKHMKTRYGKYDHEPKDPTVAHDPSNRARSSKTVDAAWQEGIREDSTSPLSKHHPVTAASGPLSVRTAPLAIPDSLNSNDFEAWSTDDLEDHALQISEWLGLVSLQSPRVHHDDQIDPYLCRYSKPDGDPPRTKKLVLLSWSGLIPAEWLRQLFIALVDCCLQHKVSSQWFALSCQAFQTEVVDCHDGYTILGLPNEDVTDDPSTNTSQPEANKPRGRVGNSFVLWEYANA
ncbi:MAG: hypothetical protein LQ338_002240 [Usnochroma carphineum]|nr:MAG: hypothetical protein LQ338_002240 [Usnochroma carphineum]